MRRFLWLAIIGLSACGYTAQELRDEPVRFRVTVPIAWDHIATCIKAAYLDKYSVVDLPVAQERRTEVVVQQMAIFDIRGTDSGTVVQFRRREMLATYNGFETQARERIERCGVAGTA